MLGLMKKLRKRVRGDRRGVTAIEYGLLAAAMGALVLSATNSLGTGILSNANSMSTALSSRAALLP
jgi:Flp pilus assembly pilin Flp